MTEIKLSMRCPSGKTDSRTNCINGSPGLATKLITASFDHTINETLRHWGPGKDAVEE